LAVSWIVEAQAVRVFTVTFAATILLSRLSQGPRPCLNQTYVEATCENKQERKEDNRRKTRAYIEKEGELELDKSRPNIKLAASAKHEKSGSDGCKYRIW